MAVQLEIQDGNPWWLSADIWTVPGSDPEGLAGTPIAGSTCFLWARVSNTGSSDVQNAVVRFYWANPSVGFDRNTANPIGTSNVNLLAGESSDVLCLTPWIPEFVNDGHECVLAEAFHLSLDPLPATPDFNVPTDRHVAQRNLSVALAARGFFTLSMVIHNTSRSEKRFQVEAHQGRLRELKPLQKRFKDGFPQKEGKLVRTAFVDQRCPSENALDKAAHERLELSIAGNRSRFATLIGRIEGGSVLVHVGQHRDDKLVGGLSVLVVNEKQHS